MEQETSGFDRWLEFVEMSARGLNRVAAYSVISRLANEAFGAHLYFAEILGRRWSYLAGKVDEQPLEADICRIPLNGNIGLVSDCWGTLSEGQCEKLVGFLKNLIAAQQGQ